MALNNTAIGGINFLAVLLSAPIIFAGVELAGKPDNSCVKILQWPVIVLGVLILLAGLVGFVGAFWRVPWLLIVYFIAMLVLIVLLACLVAFIYMVTSRGSGHPVPSRVYLEYHLNDYSGWLRRRVRSQFKWERIKNCLISANLCAELNQTYLSAMDFFNAPIGPIQSGCCKPPTLCGYQFVNPTTWISPINTMADMDCLAWSNEPTKLCYDCDSCKGGLLENLKKEWRRAGVILVITLVVLIIVYVMGCCVFRTAKTDELFSRYKQGYT
ncbi:protein TORNADO 2-like [Malania oleifera]|uniref:protein TORNADO 2-like n=1 Tax=Malania oleifera TaxID=397392 RepID=UPI0025AE369A|nr:protein TORNADO 2-like [Malania oleifera]